MPIRHTFGAVVLGLVQDIHAEPTPNRVAELGLEDDAVTGKYVWLERHSDQEPLARSPAGLLGYGPSQLCSRILQVPTAMNDMKY